MSCYGFGGMVAYSASDVQVQNSQERLDLGSSMSLSIEPQIQMCVSGFVVADHVATMYTQLEGSHNTGRSYRIIDTSLQCVQWRLSRSQLFRILEVACIL